METKKKSVKKETPVKTIFGIGVGVILLNHSGPVPSILLGKRKAPQGFGEGDWSLPGGKPDYLEDQNRFENTEETAVREVFEETGLPIKNLCRVYFSDDNFPAVGKQFVTVYFTADVDIENWSLKNVVNKEPDKCYEWRLFPINALPSQTFCGVKEALEAWSWAQEISVLEAIVGGGKEAMTPYLEPVIRLRDYFNLLRIKKTNDGVSLVKKFDKVKQAAMDKVPTGIKWSLRKKD